MGVEGRDKQKVLEAGAAGAAGHLGKTVHRLRKAYNLSLSELSEHSGVAKSIISQIERNETNPTLVTIWRLAQALDVSIERVLQAEDFAFLEKISRNDTPMLVSDDGKCRLGITGWSKTIDWLQWYDFPPSRAGFWNRRRTSVAPWNVCSPCSKASRGGIGRRNRDRHRRRHAALSRRPPACDPQHRTVMARARHDLHLAAAAME